MSDKRMKPIEVWERMPQRQKDLTLAKAWIIQHDHFLFPLEGESDFDHHARILLVFATQWSSDIQAEIDALKQTKAEIVREAFEKVKTIEGDFGHGSESVFEMMDAVMREYEK